VKVRSTYHTVPDDAALIQEYISQEMWTFLYEAALPEELFETLQKCVIEHPRIEAFYENSFWFPINAQPRLYVEHAILALKRLLPTSSGMAGAEWWIPALNSRQGMEWHCDCDRVIYAREKRFVRPQIGSVFYLNAAGGPTLVVDDVATDHTVRRPRAENGCTGYLPTPNRYGIFPGDRFHAVAISGEDQLRITVAINWWTEKPSAPLCVNAPYDSPDFAALAAPADLGELTGEARRVAPIQLSAEELAALPHRKYCPIYPRPA
jgi:hypothetical protein